MLLPNLVVACIWLFAYSQATLIPKSSISFPNSTIPTSVESSTSSSASFHILSSRTSSTLSSTTKSTRNSTGPTPSACCFVIQETVTEEWWPATTMFTTHRVVNLTSITTMITPYANGTVTNTITNTYTTNATFTAPVELDVNPIQLYENAAPIPAETDTELNGTAIVTGGVTIQSPAAFYVYSTVKIITAAPVTDTDGNVMCGTVSSWASPNYFGVQATFTNINSHAEAHFGGPNIGGNTIEPTMTATNTQRSIIGSETFTYTVTETASGTFYTNIHGSTIDGTMQSTGTIISLTTPFIYQPARGAKGALNLDPECTQSDGAENFGYIPQVLLDFMIADQNYAAQYPGLENCLPGGPSILPVARTCFQFQDETFQSAIGGDLADSTVVTVTPAGGGVHTPTIVGQVESVTVQLFGAVQSVTAQNNPPPPPPTTAAQPPVSVGAAINSMGGFSGQGGGDSGDQQGVPALITPPPAQPIIITGPTTIPVAQLPAGAQGSTTVIGGTPFLVIPSATTIAAPPSPPIPATLGSVTVIGGTSLFVIPTATTVPAASVPSGIGSTTLINGTPFVVIAPTTIALPSSTPAQTFSTTTINNTPFLLIPGPTLLPVSGLPAGITGSTTLVSGTPFLVIPAPTSVPAFPGQITVIDGSMFDVFTGATTVPVNPNLPLQGVTTVVSGTTMVELSKATTVPVLPGSLTVISGTMYDVFTGPTTVPVNGDLSLVGKTTVVSGVTEVVLSTATTVQVLLGSGVAPVQASGAVGRGRANWIGFLLGLVRGFGGRFR